MHQFMLAYHGGENPQSKEEGANQMAKWKNWIEALGDQVINPGTPLIASQLINQNGTQEDSNKNPMKGFAIVQAESMDEALAIAQKDPFLKTGGTIRVSQMITMR